MLSVLQYYCVSLMLGVPITVLLWAVWVDGCYDFRRQNRRRIMSIWTLALPLGCALVPPALVALIVRGIIKYTYLLVRWAAGYDD